MLQVALAAARLWAWAKQGLGPDQHRDVPAASDASAGIYATAPTGALSAAARVTEFRLVDLEAALYERRVLVRVRRRLVGPDREGFVYDRSGNPTSVVAVDGHAAHPPRGGPALTSGPASGPCPP
jgi:hypothetical protein